MEFKGPYLQAMREQAPQMFNRLRRTGALDKHVQEKAAEARRLFEDLTADAPKLPSGLPELPHRRAAEEQVFATLIEFQPETEPSDPLAKLPG
jgi:hypothetical protein